MDLLRAEIERKRKATEQLRRSQENSSNDGKIPKYIRQRDILLQQQKDKEELAEEMERKELERRRAHSSFAMEPSNSQPTNTQSAIDSHGENQSSGNLESNGTHSILKTLKELTLNEIKSRLRDMRQPITLFGESADDRINRLSSAILRQGMSVETEEMRHDRLLSINDDDFLNDDDEDLQDESPSKPSTEVNKADDDDSDDDKEAISRHNKNSNNLKSSEPVLYSMIPNYPHEKIVYKYFRGLLKQWEQDLNDREDHIKNSMKGKTETKIQKQCKDYLRPLFRMCKKKQMDSMDILAHLVEIVKFCEQGNFRLAHEEYLRTAIGNAAWPIGLTMVGIHERSGREKISTSKIAHVMNNEQQRKYLTSIRRLMTYAQSKRPDIPPSMKVL